MFIAILQNVVRSTQYFAAPPPTDSLVMKIPKEINNTSLPYFWAKMSLVTLDPESGRPMPATELNSGTIRDLTPELRRLYDDFLERIGMNLLVLAHPVDVAADVIVSMTKAGPVTSAPENLMLGVAMANHVLIVHGEPHIDVAMLEDKEFREAVHKCAASEHTDARVQQVYCGPVRDYLDKALKARGRTCQHCGISESARRAHFPDSPDLRQCGRCKLAVYCNSKCQSEDWGIHKDHCNANRAPTSQ